MFGLTQRVEDRVLVGRVGILGLQWREKTEDVIYDCVLAYLVVELG